MNARLNSPELSPDLALLSTASNALKSGDFQSALDQLKQLLEQNPSHELGNGMLGGVYAELGMPEKAVHFLNQTLRINPTNPLARLQLGTVLLGVQDYQGALNALAPMLKADGDFLGYFYSGLALLALGEQDKARDYLNHAQVLMPPAHALQANLQQLLAQIQ